MPTIGAIFFFLLIRSIFFYNFHPFLTFPSSWQNQMKLNIQFYPFLDLISFPLQPFLTWDKLTNSFFFFSWKLDPPHLCKPFSSSSSSVAASSYTFLLLSPSLAATSSVAAPFFLPIHCTLNIKLHTHTQTITQKTHRENIKNKKRHEFEVGERSQ